MLHHDRSTGTAANLAKCNTVRRIQTHLLTMTALHRYYDVNDNEQQQLIGFAREHQQAALATYIGLLQVIDEHNCHALFAYSILLGGLCYGFLREADAEAEREDFVGRIIALFDTLTGAVVVAVYARDWLRQGELAALMKPIPPVDDCLARIGPDSKIGLDFLLDSVPLTTEGVQETTDSHTTYTAAIRALALALPFADGELPSISEVASWPVTAGASYLAMLKELDPLALVILAYYGVALHHSKRVWFLQGLGARLVLAISKKIGEPWLPHIRWAQRKFSSEGNIYMFIHT